MLTIKLVSLYLNYLPNHGEVTTSKSSGESEKVLTTKAPETETKSEAAYVVSSLTGDIVPKKDPVFVSFGNYPDVKSIIKSKMFYPVFITGLSGNGKTMGVTQACAENKRELIRVNITIETDEDDLLGGYRLKDGQTVWQNGPVIEAMERGAVLLLDEIDLASNKIMCLQPILEGSGVFVKKINRFVNLLMVSMLLLLPILKVKVVMTVSLSVPMYLTKRFWKDFQLPLNKVTLNQVLKKKSWLQL